MKVACLFSGGKDSVYATFWSIFQGWDVVLVSVKSEDDSMMFHHPNINKTKLQADEMNLDIFYVETKNNNELKDLENKLKELKVDGIVTGAIASEYQKQRIGKIGENLNVPTYSPIWHKDSILMKEMNKYFKIYVVSVSAEGLNEEDLGKEFKNIKNIYGVHPLFEGGEGETFVSYAPFFREEIKIKKFNKKWDGIRGTAEIILSDN